MAILKIPSYAHSKQIAFLSASTLWEAILLFNRKCATTLAAASTFYILTTIVPFTLLLIRGLGFFLGDVNRVQKYIFIIAAEFFPDVAPELLETARNLIAGPLFAGKEATIFNFVLLGVSSFSILNSIWNGIYIITEDKSFQSLWKFLRGAVIMLITIVGLLVALYLPRLIVYLIYFVQTNFIIEFIHDTFSITRPVIEYIKGIQLKKSFWLISGIINTVGILGYFAWLYRWFFSAKITWRQSFLASIAFAVAIFLGKTFFWIYFEFARDGFKQNYGDLYATVLGVMWLFFLMCFFYYGACICNVFMQKNLLKKKALVDNAEKGEVV